MAKKILYLLGAGASHAEVMNTTKENASEKNGILISHVSSRVMARAFLTKKLWSKKPLNTINSKKSDFNIELLISLLEANRISESVVKELKKFVEDDIQKILSAPEESLFPLSFCATQKELCVGRIFIFYWQIGFSEYHLQQTSSTL